MPHNENPQSYWKLIDRVQEVEKNSNSETIEPTIWVSHFKDLNINFNKRLTHYIASYVNI